MALEALRLPAVIAHRGASLAHPENTLAAFEAGIGAGADMVELDVRLTADGELAVVHDPDVPAGLVHELTLDQLRGDGEPATRVPTLRETLELLRGRAAVEIEIKNYGSEPGYEPGGGPRIVEAVVGLVRELRFPDALVASFDPECVDRARRLAPEIATGQLVEGIVDLAAALDGAAERGHAFLLPDVRLVEQAGPEFVAHAHERGVRLGVWTLNEPEPIERLFAWGVDAVESDDPAMAVRVRDAMGRAGAR